MSVPISRLFLLASVAFAGLTFAGALVAGTSMASRIRGSVGDSDRSDELLAQALEKFDAGDTAGSRKLTERVLKIHPSEPFARSNLGRIHKTRGDYPRAIAEHKLALAGAPELPDLYYNVACYYALSKRKEDALRWLALALDHGFARLDHLRGDADLALLAGDPRFELLTRTGKLATGVPRVRFLPPSRVAQVRAPFEVSLVVEREVAQEPAEAAARSLRVEWEPEAPLAVLSADVSTVAERGEGYVALRTTGRWVVRGDEPGVYALPAARVTAVLDGVETVVESESFFVEIVDAAGTGARP